MKVINLEVILKEKRRGRLCVRPDGLYQFVTEILRNGDLYWMNEYPASGLYGSPDEARQALREKMDTGAAFKRVEPMAIELDVGPWADPVILD
ncbi:MAG: hypothetical protein AAF687_12300 [Pseudomonadota bacterium]